MVPRLTRRQVEAFGQRAQDGFVAREAVRLRRHFDAFRALGDEDVERFVRIGIARAEAHGIEAAADVAAYVGVMAALGEGFEGRADLPWARELLENAHMDAHTKVTCLSDRAVAYDQARDGER